MEPDNTKESDITKESDDTNKTNAPTVTFNVEVASDGESNTKQVSEIEGDIDEEEKSKKKSKLKRMYTGSEFARANIFEKSFLVMFADSRIMGIFNMARYASTIMWMMTSFFTDDWKFYFTYAAGMRNIWSGSILVLPLILIHVADIFIGNYYLISIGSVLYTVGLSILSASKPPARCDGIAVKVSTCASKEKNNLYAGLAISALGLAGIGTSVMEFAAEDSKEKEGDLESCLSWTGFFHSMVVTAFWILLVLIYFDKIKSWHTRFLIAAIFVGFSSFCFITAKGNYKAHTDLPIAPERRLIFSILRVLVASTSKVFYRHPGRKNLYKSDNKEKDALTSTLGLSWLEKAAIIPRGCETVDEQKKDCWRLCSVTEVEQTKIVFRMFPLWITWLVLGVVSSMGDTYFIEQASHLNPRLGKLKVPVFALLGFQTLAGLGFGKLGSLACKKGIPKKYERSRPAVLVGMALVSAALCCIVSAKVEQKRLRVVMKNDLMFKPDDPIPMTMFLLVPQFILLGTLDKLFETGSKDFVREFIPPSMIKYMILSTEGINGIGRIGGALSVYLVGKINHRKNRPDWFRSTLNKSRLDKYYWVLAELTAVSLGAYIIAVCWHFHREKNRIKPNDRVDVDHSNFGEDSKCFC